MLLKSGSVFIFVNRPWRGSSFKSATLGTPLKFY